MKLQKIIGPVTAVVALTAAGVLYAVHPAKGSDHQDTYNLAAQVGHNASADITDVYVFPAPDNSNNVVLAMDVFPLIAPGLGASKNFDPTLMWQFKISHGAATNAEDEVIQFSAAGTGSTQTISLYGPGKPKEVGTNNTFISQAAGSTTIGTEANLQSKTIQFYAGERADPFTFDLFAFYSFLGDRNWGTHTSQSDPGTGNTFSNGNNASNIAALVPPYDKAAARATTPSFNGFTSGTTSGSGAGAYACSSNPATNVLGGFNVLSLVVELPKSLLENGYSSHTINVWATVGSSTVNS